MLEVRVHLSQVAAGVGGAGECTAQELIRKRASALCALYQRSHCRHGEQGLPRAGEHLNSEEPFLVTCIDLKKAAAAPEVPKFDFI